MARTVTQPPDDQKMWRRLVARAHPDAGGCGELFIWATATRDAVCKGIEAVPPAEREPRPYDESPRPSPSPADAAERVPFYPLEDFDALTRKILAVAEEVPSLYGRLLRLVADCAPATHGRAQLRERRGATYRQLALIAHVAGMTKPERIRWYRLAESLPLSQRHAGHILTRLKGGAP